MPLEDISEADVTAVSQQLSLQMSITPFLKLGVSTVELIPVPLELQLRSPLSGDNTVLGWAERCSCGTVPRFQRTALKRGGKARSDVAGHRVVPEGGWCAV